MSASIDLIDKYKKACAITSDNACGASLGVSRSAVSLWRNGKGHPEADLIEKMCKATGENPAKWLPLIEAERARSPEARKAWLRLAQIAAAITLAVGISPAHAEAITNTHNVPSHIDIMRSQAGSHAAQFALDVAGSGTSARSASGTSAIAAC